MIDFRDQSEDLISLTTETHGFSLSIKWNGFYLKKL
jgi:hypothetical protein